MPSATSKVRIIEGGANNLPDENSHRAALEIYGLLNSLKEDDIVLALISGTLFFVMYLLAYVEYDICDFADLCFTGVVTWDHSFLMESKI